MEGENQSCLICQSTELIPYLNLGVAALANAYVPQEQLGRAEPKYPLILGYCKNCHLSQLITRVDRRLLFDNYSYVSSASFPLIEHFAKYATNIYKRYPTQSEKLVVDIGSNDGLLLQSFKKFGCRVLGIDPAKNIAMAANNAGIETIPDFFGKKLGRKIGSERGKVGVVTANNILAHTNDLHDIFWGVEAMMADDGIFVFEVQYLKDLIDKNEFDNVYHEHTCFYLLTPIVRLLDMHGMTAIDVERIDTQGGSIRVIAARHSAMPHISWRVTEMLEAEKQSGLLSAEGYQRFAERPVQVRTQLHTLLARLRAEGKRVVGYGAPAKGMNLLQYCGVGPELIEYIVDTTPYKQGRYSPGTHIPIYAPEKLQEAKPDYCLLLAWNYSAAILQKEQALLASGVQFIIPVPEVRVVGDETTVEAQAVTA